MSNNKKQTAVEWLLDRIEDVDSAKIWDDIKQQAKEMEKQKHEKLSASWAKSREKTRETAMHIGFAKGFMSGLQCHEDYYEELNTTQLDEEEFTRNYITDRFEETQGGANESN